MTSMLKNKRGFTLIEIVVALLVLSIASTVIFEGFSVGFRNARTADDFAQAVLIAQSKLAPTGVAEPLSAGTTSGEELDKYSWTVTVNAIDITELAADDGTTPSQLRPFSVAVDVIWSDGGTKRTVSLSTLRLASQ
ncbi:MAG: prepilin-type N-terminal cleavage/methylation domain-containing protein [Alphaproteobacteria bacterium]|nr:prepilin-type N-terminal cleavage/methylation domain-containing protein [Alphaproteobacteria bacterium]